MANEFVSPLVGLQVSANSYALPEGSLHVADNVVMRAKGVIESRRGHSTASNAFSSTSSHTARTFAFYNGGHVVQYNGAPGAVLLAYATSGAYTTHSDTFDPPSTALRMKFAELSSNLYFNTSLGVKGITSISATPAEAGLRRVPEFWYTSHINLISDVSGTAGSWMTKNSQVAYAATIIYKDANGNLKESAPSGRAIAVNPADQVMAIGTMTRVGASVTATVTAHKFKIGDWFTLSPGEANFSAGNYQIASVTATTIVYSNAGAAASNTIEQTISSGTKYTALSIQLPTSVPAGASVRVYRSLMTATDATAPSEELYQVYEARLGAAEITAESTSFSDKTPESSLYSNPLYTNPKTGDGILQSNDPPPVCKDLCVWKERLWFANTVSRHRYTTQVLGIGSPDGLQNGDLVIIGGAVFTAVTGTPANNYEFRISAFTDSASENIRGSALSFDTVVNRANVLFGSDVTTYKAQYISGSTDAPGKILFEEDAIAGSPFYFAASRPASWSPVPPAVIAVTEASSGRAGSTVTITTADPHGFSTGDSIYLASNDPHASFSAGVKASITVTNATTFTYSEAGATSATIPSGTYYVHAITQVSDNDTSINKIFYSKHQQPEAVPLLNYVTVGAKNKAILRIFPSRDKLLVFKEDAIYIVSGDPSGSLRVDLLDATARLLAPDSVAAANNQVYALTNQGVVTVSDAGVALVSRQIESYIASDFFSYVAGGSTAVKAGVWACAYDSERQYLLGIGTADGQEDVLCYNILSNAWTRWPGLQYRFGAVDPVADKLYFAPGAAATNKLRIERKDITYTDYADYSQSYQVSSVSGNVLTLSADVDPVPGAGAVFGTQRVVSALGPTITVTNGAAFTPLSSYTLYYPISCAVEFAPQAFGAPGVTKQFSETHLHFQRLNAYQITASARTEAASTATTSTLNPSGFVIGTNTFSSTNPTLQNQRLLVPGEKQRACVLRFGMSVSEAWAMWQLLGFSVELTPSSSRSVR